MSTHTFTHLFANFYPGKITLAEEMNGIAEAVLSLVSDAVFSMQGPDGYGLMATPELKMSLTLAGKTLQLHSLAAVSPGGSLILQHPTFSPELCLDLPEDAREAEFFVFVRAAMTLRDWNLPGVRPNSLQALHKVPEYELCLKSVLEKDMPGQYRDALPVGRIYLKNGDYLLDDKYLPPCLHLKASDYLWQSLLQSRALWERMLRATHRILLQTTGVPYNAPLGDLHRLAFCIWHYMAGKKPEMNYLREKSHPSELVRLWAGIASLFGGYIPPSAHRTGEILQLMERYSQGRPGYIFHQQDALSSAQGFSDMQYDSVRLGTVFNVLHDFLQQVCMAWIFLGETPNLRWEIDQNPHKL